MRCLTSSRGVVGLATVLCVLMVMAERAATQTPATGRLMRQKLVHAQRLLEAITTSNYTLLERFLRATQSLLDAAKARDLDKAVGVYQDVTMSCYRCHQYIKNMRLAK
jgi:hypothetical protein